MVGRILIYKFTLQTKIINDMDKKSVICIGGALLGCLYSCSEKKEVKKNVIYILADDLGYGDVGCYGQDRIHTPNIDRMAKEGLIFTQHYAGSTVSAPSRASLMTGLHTGHTQVRGNKEIMPEGQAPMSEDTFTIGKLMQNAGYKTGIFGKWGLGFPNSTSTPDKMGFDEFYGYNCQRQAHSYYPNHLWHNNEKIIFENNKKEKNVFSQNIIHKNAMEFIRKNKDNNFFAMLTYTLPHAELAIPKDSIYSMYENKFDEKEFKGRGDYSAVKDPNATFAAMVSTLDKYVGEIIEEVKKLGIEDKTIIIFTSDNGPHREGGANPDYFKSYGKLRGVKRDLYEGGIRVPMIAWGKDIAKGETNHISAFWDIMPTLADITKTKLNLKTDGISMLPTLYGKGEQKEHKYLYWEFHEMGGRKAVRQGNWKLIVQPIRGESKIELYRLDKDIHEDNNIAEENKEKTQELLKIMDNARVHSDVFNFGIQN